VGNWDLFTAVRRQGGNFIRTIIVFGAFNVKNVLLYFESTDYL
jgi:hypothetical protein